LLVAKQKHNIRTIKNNLKDHESTSFASVAEDSEFLSSNLLLLAAYPVSLARFLSLWVEYECDPPLFKITSSLKGSQLMKEISNKRKIKQTEKKKKKKGPYLISSLHKRCVHTHTTCFEVLDLLKSLEPYSFPKGTSREDVCSRLIKPTT
jgi:uncharacterized protein YozE (UPF0346 family)